MGFVWKVNQQSYGDLAISSPQQPTELWWSSQPQDGADLAISSQDDQDGSWITIIWFGWDQGINFIIEKIHCNCIIYLGFNPIEPFCDK